MFEQADGQGRCQELREHRVLGAALSCHLTIMFLKKTKILGTFSIHKNKIEEHVTLCVSVP